MFYFFRFLLISIITCCISISLADGKKTFFPEYINQIQLGDTYETVSSKLPFKLVRYYSYNKDEFVFYVGALYTIYNYKFANCFYFHNGNLYSISFGTLISHDNISEIIDYFLNFLEPYYGKPTVSRKEKYTSRSGKQILQHFYEWKLDSYRFTLLGEQHPNFFICISIEKNENPFDKLLDSKSFDKSLEVNHSLDPPMRELVGRVYDNPQKFPPEKGK